VACLLAVGPVEGTFTYVTARRRLLDLVERFWAACLEIGEDMVTTNLTKILERGVWPVSDYMYLLMKDMVYNMSSEDKWNRGVDAILAQLPCPALPVNVFLCVFPVPAADLQAAALCSHLDFCRRHTLQCSKYIPDTILRRWLAAGVTAGLSWHLFHADRIGIALPRSDLECCCWDSSVVFLFLASRAVVCGHAVVVSRLRSCT
jgi:hypothetical protein